MTRHWRLQRSGFFAALLCLALLAAACGGGGSSVSSGKSKAGKKSAAATSSTAPANATVKLADSSLGKILVDVNGRTLYELDRDTATSATCTGACTSIWPPLTVSGTPTAGTGLDAAKLATLDGPNGHQVTYGGHPLYTFANDKAAGDVNGQGFAGGVWWVVGADGQKLTTAATTTAPATTPPTAAPQTAPPATSPPATS
ncbi:MAG TPA: hypothetical protein VGA62_03610, partial [Acidimicrobiia bacterium]